MKMPGAIFKRPLNVALVDVCEEHCRVLKETCAAAGYSPVFKTTCNVCTDGLGRWADLVVIECDLCFRALHSAEKARRCGTCPVGVLVNWWSDLERDASEAADFVIHVPLAADEIRLVLAAVPTRPEGAQRSGRMRPVQGTGLPQGPHYPSRERAATPSPGHGARPCSRAARRAHQRRWVRQALRKARIDAHESQLS